MSYWSIVIPHATKNRVPNPSFENDATGWSATWTGSATGSLARSTAWSRFGLYGYAVTKSGGTGNYGPYIATSDYGEFSDGDTAYASVYLSVPSGMTVTLDITVGSSATHTNTSVAGPYEGRLSVEVAIGETPTYISFWVYTADNGTFYCDGAQFEADYLSDYCDGDQDGCYWSSVYHNSASGRYASARAGGRAVDPDDYAFYIRKLQGIGVPTLDHQTDQLPQQDGSLYRDTRVNQRQITLQGTLIGTSRSDLHSKRKALFDLLKLDNAGKAGAMELRYSGSGDPMRLKVFYQDGMTFGGADGYSEEIALRFISPDPYWFTDARSSANLTIKDTLTNASYGLLKERGVWQAMDTTGTTNGILCAAISADGKIYVGGNFSSLGGVSNTAKIAVWYDDVWHPLSSGLNDTVNALVFGPDGILYVGGVFENADGDADADFIASYDPSTDSFSPVGGAPTLGTKGPVYALAMDSDGILYAGGNFTSIAGVAANYVAEWDGSSWSAMGTGMDDSVRALVVAPNGDVYAGGDFTTADGGSADNIAVWDDSAWSDIGGTNDIVRALAIGPDGLVYASGDFTTAGGTTVNYVTRYNGSGFESLAGGTNGVVYHLHRVGSLMYAGGAFSQAGGTQMYAKTAVWNGTSWVNQDFLCNGDVYVVLQQQEDVLFVGYLSTGGDAYVSYLNTVSNDGSRLAFPVLTISRSGGSGLPVLWLENLDTGAKVYLNYNLLDGEQLVIDFRPGHRSVVSSMFGDVWKAVLRGSNFADFYLLPGDNRIAIFAYDQTSPTVVAQLAWTPTYYAADGA